MTFQPPVSDQSQLATNPFSLLSPQMEQDLANRWRTEGDRNAFNRLVTSHIRLVHSLAHKLRGYQLDHEDLVGEGVLGLIRAAEKFEPERGFRFSTYAVWHIRAAMQRFILSNWSIVKTGTTANQRKLFFNLRRILGKIEIDNPVGSGSNCSSTDKVHHIAKELNVPESEVESMWRRLESYDVSLNSSPTRQSVGIELQDLITSEEQTPAEKYEIESEKKYLSSSLHQAVEALPNREKFIVKERHLSASGMTLKAIASVFNISQERSRQLETRALKMLREFFIKNTNIQPALAK